MGKKLQYSFRYDSKTIDGEMHIDLSRFERQYSKAQYALDTMVMHSMIPFMPKQTGTFINVTQGMSEALAGSGQVVAAAPPMGRFLYEGKVMVGEKSRSAFAKKAERKVTLDRPLQYSKHANPNVTDRWFDAAKKRYGDKWVKKAKEIAGGG